MATKPLDLIELYQTALAKADSEVFITTPEKETLERVLEAVAAEVRKYRTQMQKMKGAMMEPLQEQKHAPRFSSWKSVR